MASVSFNWHSIEGTGRLRFAMFSYENIEIECSAPVVHKEALENIRIREAGQKYFLGNRSRTISVICTTPDSVESFAKGVAECRSLSKSLEIDYGDYPRSYQSYPVINGESKPYYTFDFRISFIGVLLHRNSDSYDNAKPFRH